MKYFVLTYDPLAEADPRVQEFEDDLEAFQVLEAETLQNLGSDGVEVVLFYCDSERTLRSANQRYFNPEVTRRLRESSQPLRSESERMANQLIGLAPSPRF
ncbi:MAG: hypothetical protein OXG27_03560 [Chloroflexi bacterium]|nr:hypothetical protein [Chloroflexota bacterium]